jgi:ABC-type arginine/histidine transport system permease subunit
MSLNFKQAILCYSLIHSVLINLASLTNQFLQAVIDATPRGQMEAAALLKKKEAEDCQSL